MTGAPQESACPFCRAPVPFTAYDRLLAQHFPALAREQRAWWRQHLASCPALSEP